MDKNQPTPIDHVLNHFVEIARMTWIARHAAIEHGWIKPGFILAESEQRQFDERRAETPDFNAALALMRHMLITVLAETGMFAELEAITQTDWKVEVIGKPQTDIDKYRDLVREMDHETMFKKLYMGDWCPPDPRDS